MMKTIAFPAIVIVAALLVSVLKLVESLESFVFQRRRSDSLGRAADVDTEKPAEIRS